jgi:hypothetical protein
MWEERRMNRGTAKGFAQLLVMVLLLIAVPPPSIAATPSYDPATTIVVLVHGFDPDGFNAVGVFGDDLLHDDVARVAAVLRQPTWQDDPNAANQIAATTYYGDTPPAWYTDADRAADLNAAAGIPRYALRVARYIRHVLERAPAAAAVNILSASLGTEVSRYLIEHDFLSLASEQKITRWGQLVGVTIGNWTATHAPDLLTTRASPDVEQMTYEWVNANISANRTMNSPLYGPMIIGHWIATDDGDGVLTALSNKPNDGTILSEDQYFSGYTTEAALHRATDGMLQMPSRSFGHTIHAGIRNNDGAFAGIAAMSQNNVRVTVTLTRAKALSTGDSLLQGKGEWVFSASVMSPRAAVLYGTTQPLNHYVRQGGNPPLFPFGRNETRFPNLVLFDQIVPPGETELELTLWAEELDWHPQFYRVTENPFGNNKNMGAFNVTLPTTEPSVTRMMNGNMDLDVTVTVRTVY